MRAEDEIDEILEAKKTFVENPLEKDDFILQARSGIHVSQVREQRKRGKMPEPTIEWGKNKAGVASKRRFIAVEDHKAYHDARPENPVPPHAMTVRDVAQVFRLSENQILNIFQVPHRTKGLVRCDCRRKGRPSVQYREGYHIDKAKVRREWQKRSPGVPLPPVLAESDSTVAAARMKHGPDKDVPEMGDPVADRIIFHVHQTAARLEQSIPAKTIELQRKKDKKPSSNLERDAFICKLDSKGNTLKQIKDALREHPEWEQIETEQGIHAAIERHKRRA